MAFRATMTRFTATIEKDDRGCGESGETSRPPVERKQRIHEWNRHGDVDRSELDVAGKTEVRIYWTSTLAG